MKKMLLSLAFAAAAVPCAAAMPQEHVGRDAERGDPARWSIPDETPQQRYRTSMKEAGAALAEALRECRAAGADRKSCEAEARAQYQSDAARAKARLARPQAG
jgi:hypothetical protein